MTQKTISLNEKAYKILRKFKGNKESYSDLIIRLCEVQEKEDKEDILLKYIGLFKDNSDYWEQVEKEIQKERNLHLTSEENKNMLIRYKYFDWITPRK
ncbi:MAG TPA: antitoxin VapB family protein [Candidatus Lokiarchaeia archaeon]